MELFLKPFALDWQAFEKVSDGVMNRVTKAEPCSYRLGDKVKDKDTGLVGNITRLWTYINGCVFAHIALPAKGNFITGKEAVDGLHVGIVRLEAVKTVSEPVKPKKTSGPATRLPHM